MAAVTVDIQAGDNSSGTTLTDTIVATAGRCIILGATNEVSDVGITITDTALNTYTGKTKRAHANGDNWAQIHYAKNISGHATNVILCTWASAVGYRAFSGHEYSGLSTTEPYESEDWDEEDSSTTITVPAMAASGAGVVFAVFKAYNDSNWTVGTDFTNLLQEVSGDASLAATENRIITGAGSYSAPITRGSATNLLAVGAIFVDTAGGGGGGATRGTSFGHRGTVFNGGRTFHGIIQ